MQLKAGERLTLLMVLPEQGDLTTIRIVDTLRADLSFTEDEHAALEIAVDPEGGSVRWNGEADTGREYEFGAKAREVIVKALEKMSSEGKLTAQHLTVCDKFGLEG